MCNNDYNEWFLRLWEEEKGLLTSSDSASLLNVTKFKFYKLAKQGKIKTFSFGSREVLYSYKEIMSIRNNCVQLELNLFQEQLTF